MPKVFLPQKKITLEAPLGENLMTFLQTNEFPVASSCLGDGVCSMCRMQVKAYSSNSAAVPQPLEGPSDFEKSSLTRNKCEPGERLSCQISIHSDIEVTTKYW